MACGTYPDAPLQYFLEWRFMDGVVCTFGDQLGVGVTMLLFFGITFLTLYQASDSVAVPVGALIVLAPAAMALLPAIGVQFVVVVVIITIAIAGTYLYTQAG
ncbi:MAG: hypothetical protein ACNS61_16210 [Candidatus Wenzhouxiangella sp. M2_3B_020]